MATLLETASLVMVPSGYEDGTLGSLVPTDASGDFTFTRGSNLSATRVNEQGFIEKGYENLLLQSNSFDTTWIPRDATITGGQAGYDGTNDAWLLQAVSNGYNRRIYQSVSLSSVFTFSFYAKANTSNYAQAIVFNSTGADPKSYFNLSTGETGTTTDSIDVNMADVGDGWYRCSITGNASVSQIWLLVSDYGYTNLVDAGGSIYIQDAQLNQSLVSYPYVETTTAPEKGGILADLPRVDYSSGGASLLLEPQRTNLVPHSEYFGGWSTADSTVTLIQDANPIDSVAYEIKSSVTANTSRIYQNGLMTSGNDYVSSYLVKPSANPPEYIGFACISNLTPDVLYNFATDSFEDFNIVGNAAKCESISMTNGWKLLKVPVHENVINTRFNIYQGGRAGSRLNAIAGQSYYIKFAQLEEASYPTSYIPTYGTSQTRLRDSASKTGISNLIGQTEGAVFLEVGEVHNNSATGPTKWFFRVIKDANNSFGIGSGGIDSNPPIRFVTIVGGVITTEHEAAGFSNSKIVIKYTSTDFKLFQNGVLKNITSKSIGGYADIAFMEGASDNLSMPLKQHIVFPTALSDEACIELTTL